MLSIHWLYWMSCYSVVKKLGVDVIGKPKWRQYVNLEERDTLLAPPMLKSNAGDQKVCKKKNLSWLFGADRKTCPSGSLFGITRQSLMMPDSDPQMYFSVRTSHPWKILILWHMCFLCHWSASFISTELGEKSLKNFKRSKCYSTAINPSPS